MKFVWIIAIIAAIGGGVYWWQRGEAAPTSAPAAAGSGGGGVAVAGDAGMMAIDAAMVAERAVTPTAPAIAPGLEPVAPPPAEAATFEQEVRDPAWAVDQELELRGRLDAVAHDLARRKLKVTIAAAECRARACRIEVGAAGQRELSAFYGALETPEGLLGWADGIVLGDVETDATTGAMTTRITVAFERDL